MDLQKEIALYWDCRWLSDGQSGFGSAPWCSYHSSLHSRTAWMIQLNRRAAHPQHDSRRPSETRGQDCLSEHASDWVTKHCLLQYPSASWKPPESNSCGVVTAHTHLKTDLFQMESYRPLPSLQQFQYTAGSFLFFHTRYFWGLIYVRPEHHI